MFRRVLMSAAGILGACSLLLLSAMPASAAVVGDGYDVSWPQCTSTGSTAPTGSFAFAIIGVNDGKPYTANPCLSSEAASAGGAALSFYVNTANPGPHFANWPAGKTANGVTCPALRHYSNGSQALLDCTYVFGYLSAENAVAGAGSALGSVPSTQWWLDVESANSWMKDKAANVSDIRGAADYLAQEANGGAGGVGVYTNASSWSSITGGTQSFSAYAAWAPGYTDSSTAAAGCGATSPVTGGRISTTQWVTTFDMDYAC